MKSLALKPVEDSSEHSIHYEPKEMPAVRDIEKAETRAERNVVERLDKEIANCRIKMANAQVDYQRLSRWISKLEVTHERRRKPRRRGIG